jgi:hypothetical protein
VDERARELLVRAAADLAQREDPLAAAVCVGAERAFAGVERARRPEDRVAGEVGRRVGPDEVPRGLRGLGAALDGADVGEPREQRGEPAVHAEEPVARGRDGRREREPIEGVHEQGVDRGAVPRDDLGAHAAPARRCAGLGAAAEQPHGVGPLGLEREQKQERLAVEQPARARVSAEKEVRGRRPLAARAKERRQVMELARDVARDRQRLAQLQQRGLRIEHRGHAPQQPPHLPRAQPALALKVGQQHLEPHAPHGSLRGVRARGARPTAGRPRGPGLVVGLVQVPVRLENLFRHMDTHKHTHHQFSTKKKKKKKKRDHVASASLLWTQRYKSPPPCVPRIFIYSYTYSSGPHAQFRVPCARPA